MRKSKVRTQRIDSLPFQKVAKFKGEELLKRCSEFHLRTKAGMRIISIDDALAWYLRHSKAQPGALFTEVIGRLRGGLLAHRRLRQFRELIAH